MERRHFLKVALGFAAGAATLVTSMRSQAAPLPPLQSDNAATRSETPATEPAVASQTDIDNLKPEDIRWGRGRRRRFGWRRRFGLRRRFRRRRFYGFRRRRFWRRRFWRRRWW